MKMKLNLLRSLFLVLIAVLPISSCDFSNVRFGEVRMMVGSNEDGHISYNYSIFTGVENGSIQVGAGERISFDYHVTVTRGNLLIEWQDPGGEAIWQVNLHESGSGEDIITAESSGTYRVIIQGKDAGGDFDISWKSDEM